jgi:protein LTV1
VPLSAEARARLALVPEEAADDDFDTHPFLRGLVIDEREEAEARWDCATIVSTYSNTENHPTLVRVRPRKAQERILLGPRGMPIGAHALPGVAAAAKAKSGAARRDDADGGGSDDDDDDDDESVITLGGAARQRGESAEEKRARKAAVKAERACRRMEKKQTKELFAKERTKAMHVVASAQPNGLQI